MRSLIRKELRSLIPFLALVALIGLLDGFFLIVAQFPDQQPLSERFEGSSREFTSFGIFFIAISLSAGLLVREKDEGTLAFLDGLPVSRSQLFLAKLLPAFGVLLLIPLLDAITTCSVHALSTNSLQTTLPWQPILACTIVQAVQCFVWLSVGLALSFLRRVAFLALAVLLWSYILLAEARVEWVTRLNVFAIGDPVFAGREWLLPLGKIATQLAVALACLGIAFAAFQLQGDRAQRLLDATRPARGRRILTGLATLVIAGLWIGLVVNYAQKQPDPSERPRPEWAPVRISTSRYQFTVPGGRTETASPLVAQADQIEARVRGFIGATPLEPIQVDLTAGMARHAGLAYWKRVRMNLSESDDPMVLGAILAHETTHVMLDHHSAGHLTDDFNSTRFFHEGVASYVEYHLFRDTNTLRELRRVAAAARDRSEIRLEDLLNDGKFSSRFDRDLVYPLGEVFTAALVRRHGESAPGAVAKALGRPDAPKNLAGIVLWQDTLQSLGYDWSGVNDEWDAILEHEVKQHRDYLAGVPRLRGAVVQEGSRVGVRVEHDGTGTGTIVCRFRPEIDSADRFYVYAYSLDGKTFWTERSGLPGPTFWYQLGWIERGAALTIYDPWVEGRIAP